MEWNVRIMKRVENELKCFVLIVNCLFVILVIHHTLQLFSLDITNDSTPTPTSTSTPTPTPTPTLFCY